MRLRLLPPVTVVDTQETAAEVLQYLMNRGGTVAIDTETTGLDLLRSDVICWSMATEDQRYFIPVKYLLFFDRLFRRTDIIWRFANAKFDAHMLANRGVHLAGTWHDIIVMDALEDDTRPHGLKEQSKLAYGVDWGDFKELFLDPTYVSQHLQLDKHDFTRFKRMSVGERLLYVYEENRTIVEDYASCDAYFTYLRGEDLARRLSTINLPTELFPDFNTLWDYFTTIEAPFTKVLWKLERTGMPVDLDYVRKLDGPMRDSIRASEKAIAELVGSSYNPSSVEETVAMLFSKSGFNLTPTGYTKTGAPTTGEKDLERLIARVKGQKAHDFLKALLDYRHITKLHGTFVAKIGTHLGPDERVHSRFNQAGSRTGRLSNSSPNLMQIPVRNDQKYSIRRMFCAPRGCYLISCDYPQIQPRLAAVFAKERKMLEDILAGFDLYGANAANMFKHLDSEVSYDRIEGARQQKERDKNDLTEQQWKMLKYRDAAKTVTLGVLFGEGPRKMSHQLKIEFEAAEDLLNGFFTTYPNIKYLIDETRAFARENGYAYTLLGRMRQFHNINNGYNRGIEMAEERQAFNHLIQGSEGEIMKLSMLQLDASKLWQELGGELCLTVHDELLAFIPQQNAKEGLAHMKEIMADPYNWQCIKHRLPIPIDPDGKYGDNWTEAH